MRNGRRYAAPRDIITLIMVLPGKIAKDIRSKFAAIIEKYIAVHHDPVSGTTTVELQSEPVESMESQRKRIKREDLELAKLEQEIQEKRIQNFTNCMGMLTSITPNWMQSDVRFRLQTEDMIKNLMTQTPVLANTNSAPNAAITNGDASGSGMGSSISISQVAQELGKRLSHGQSIQVGGLVARKYRDRYDTYPPKHSQWVDGAERKVNSYTERDREIIVEALKELGMA